MDTLICPKFIHSLRIKAIASSLAFFLIPITFILYAGGRSLRAELWVFILVYLIFLTIGIIWLYISKNVYKGTSYKIYEDRIMHRQLFFGDYLKEIQFTNIKEIGIAKGPYQIKYGLGDIIIHTQASSPGSNVSTGLKLFDIENVEQVYELLKKKISGK